MPTTFPGISIEEARQAPAISDDFNVTNEVYKEKQDIASYIDSSLTTDALAAKK